MHAFTSSCGRTGRTYAATELSLRVSRFATAARVPRRLLFLVSLPAAARPAILEETARLTSPPWLIT